MTATTTTTTTGGERPGQLPTALLALAAGVAAFLLVGVAVTAALAPWIEFSLLVGVPAGVVAGVVTVVLVAFGLRAADEAGRTATLARATGWFGTVLLAVAVLTVASGVLSVTLGLLTGIIAGLFAAAASALR